MTRRVCWFAVGVLVGWITGAATIANAKDRP